MSDTKRTVLVVPCSGIGKPQGTITREAAYEVTQDLRPDRTRIVALSLLVLGDEESRGLVASCPAVTVDGCKLACARKMVELSGGQILQAFDVLDLMGRHRQLKPQGIAELNGDGAELVKLLAGEIASRVDGHV